MGGYEQPNIQVSYRPAQLDPTRGFRDSINNFQNTITGIQGRNMADEVMREKLKQQEFANKLATDQAAIAQAKEADRVAAVKLGNDRLQQYKDITSTPIELGRDIGLDADQMNAQLNASDNVNRVFNDQVGTTYQDAFKNSVAGTKYGNEAALQQAVIAGDQEAIDLYEDAQWQAGAAQDKFMDKMGLKTPDTDGGVNALLGGTRAIEAMSTPTLEQKYKGMLNKTNDPVVRKQIVDSFGGEVATAQAARAATAAERGKRADEMVKEQSKLLREFTGYSGSSSGSGKPSTSELSKVMKNLNIDVSNWTDDDQRAVFGLSQELANKKGYENVDTDAYFADAMRQGKEVTGEWTSSANKVDRPDKLKAYVDKEIAKDIAAGRARTVKTGSKGYKGMGYNTALKAQKKIFAEADKMRTTSGRLDSANAEVNRAFAPYIVSDADIKKRIEDLNTSSQWDEIKRKDAEIRNTETPISPPGTIDLGIDPNNLSQLSTPPVQDNAEAKVKADTEKIKKLQEKLVTEKLTDKEKVKVEDQIEDAVNRNRVQSVVNHTNLEKSKYDIPLQDWITGNHDLTWADVGNDIVDAATSVYDMATGAYNTVSDAYQAVDKWQADNLNPMGTGLGKTPDNLAAEVPAKATPKVKEDTYLNALAKVESNNSYTAENKGSGAYGKYQILPSTAAEFFGKDGITKDNWKEPKVQDKIFNKLHKRNTAELERANLPLTQLNMYGAHQQGVKGYKEILNYVQSSKRGGRIEPLSTSRIKNMRSNLPGDEKFSDTQLPHAWLAYWGSKFKNTY